MDKRLVAHFMAHSIYKYTKLQSYLLICRRFGNWYFCLPPEVATTNNLHACHLTKSTNLSVENSNKKEMKHGHQVLLKAKYCPRVATASHRQKNTKTHVTLTFEYDLEIQ